MEVQGDTVLLPPNIARDQHVTRRGEERSKGSVVFERSAEITPLAISVLASVGVRRISVIAPFRLAVITTGQELVLDYAQLGGEIASRPTPVESGYRGDF
ncbi:MAG: hypothetical protein JXA30_04775 [Deltaproteobacteria bacterium]|nr:hypothetical protein [Deltaproteobacteria bacterium]